ncbi:hypothetical protein NFI96_005278 [Prochilodus magdalenae]|nr:hypothetical protein NFI96_005278 [Prochilodus magdalenae]
MVEGWTYVEGLYFCFITLTTVGFGDYAAGVNPSRKYQMLYRFAVEMWIYMGLAWLSLFFSWNVHMVVEAHKVLKKRRQMRHRAFPYNIEQVQKAPLPHVASIVDIFKFMSEKGEDYSDVIRAIGTAEKRKKQQEDELTRSKSCSDLLKEIVIPLDQSPPPRRRFSIGDNVYMVISRARGSTGDLEERQSLQEPIGDPELGMEGPSDKALPQRPARCARRSSYTPVFQTPRIRINSAESVGNQNGSRFSVFKVEEEVGLLEKGNGPG